MRISDWSSDVCSSDLRRLSPRDPWFHGAGRRSHGHRHEWIGASQSSRRIQQRTPCARRLLDGPFRQSEQREQPILRSEERRVGKSVSVRVDLGGRRIIKKKTNTTKLYT